MRKWTESQLTAIETHGRDLLISAAAGAGKTATLTERVIRSVIGDGENGTDISRILIVTYTRSAAAELKSRISEALSKAISKEPTNTRLRAQLLKLGSAHISTIDSFYLDAVKANFERFSLPASFRVADSAETEPLYRSVMSEVIDDFYTKYQSTSDADSFPDIMDNFIGTRDDSHLEELFIDLYSDMMKYPDGIKALRICAQKLDAGADKDFYDSDFGKVIKNRVASLLSFMGDTLADICEQMKGSDILVAKYLDSFVYDRDFIKRAYEINKTSYTDTLEYLYSYSPIGLKSISAKDKTDESELFKNIRTKFKSYLEKDIKNSFFCFTPGQNREHMKRSAGICEMLYSLLEEYDRRVMAEKASRGICDFDDIRRFMKELVTDDDGSITEIAKKYREQFDEIYIDEYQDVDEVQDRIFSAVSKPGRRFMVGDIKQSIYGFRGAEPSVFASYRSSFPEINSPDDNGKDGCSIFMSNNFRCDENIIKFTNLVCSHTFSACRDSINYTSSDDLIFSKNENTGKAKVKVFLTKVKPEDENEAGGESEYSYIAKEIGKLLESGIKNDRTRYSPEDIAVLVRASDTGEELKKTLEGNGIKSIVTKKDNVFRSDGFLLLTDLIKTISNPMSDIPLASILPRLGFGIDENSLAKIRADSKNEFSLYEAIKRYADGGKDADDAKKCADFLAWLSTYRKISASLSLEKLIRQLSSDEYTPFDISDKTVQKFYDIAVSYESHSYSGICGFIAYLDGLIGGDAPKAEDVPPDAVRILTIHESKGLEYPAVFLCGCGKEFNNSSSKESLVYNRYLGAAMHLSEKGQTGLCDTLMRRAVCLLNKEDEIEEEMRILYVAFTRAREKLFISATFKADADDLPVDIKLCEKGMRLPIIKCTSFIEWILAAISHPDKDQPCDCYRIVASSSEPDNGEADAPDAKDDENADENKDDPTVTASSDRFIEWAKGVNEARKSSVYPYSVSCVTGAKVAVTSIHDGMFASEAQNSSNVEEIEEQIRKMPSLANMSFLKERENESEAARRGSAVHAFLQFCDFSRLEKDGEEAELSRLIQKSFISRNDASLIDLSELEKIKKSGLLQIIRSASDVVREFKFNIFLSPQEIDSSAPAGLENEKIQVQGATDLILIGKEGDITLIDYKTDRLTRAEMTDPSLLAGKMTASHGRQLSVYSLAIEKIYGKRPDRIYIYSTHAGALVPMAI